LASIGQGNSLAMTFFLVCIVAYLRAERDSVRAFNAGLGQGQQEAGCYGLLGVSSLGVILAIGVVRLVMYSLCSQGVVEPSLALVHSNLEQ